MRAMWLALAMAVTGQATAEPPPGVAAYLAMFDRNADHKVDLDEYVAYMMTGFERMDRNRDNQLDASEIPHARNQQLPVSRQNWRDNLAQAFKRMDRNADGYLDTAEMALPPPR